MGQTFLVRHNCINIETYLYISETTFNCDKFVTDRDNNIYKCDNFYLYNNLKCQIFLYLVRNRLRLLTRISGRYAALILGPAGG